MAVTAGMEYPSSLVHCVLELLPVCTSSAHLPEKAVAPRYETAWLVELQYLPSSKDHDTVVVEDRFQPVGDGDHYRSREHLANSALYLCKSGTPEWANVS